MQKKKTEVFLFVDALGWEIVKNFEFMKKELPFRFPVQMQFGYSSSAIPTILSGRRPEEHGHLSFYFRAEGKRSPFRLFRYLPFGSRPNSPFNRGRVRGWISRIFKFLNRYTGYFQLYNVPFDRLPYFDYCEKQDIFAPSGLAPFENLQDLLKKSGLPYHISDWRRPEKENLERAELLMRENGIRFYFLYTAGLDALLHMQIRNPDAIRQKLAFYETHIREMLKLLEESGTEFHFTVISDHGMTPLKGVSDLKKCVESLGLTFGVDYLACYDSTMFRLWGLQPGAREKIRKAVDGAFPGHFLSKDEKIRYGIDFKDQKYGEEIFLMDPGWQIAPSDMGKAPLPGMHGFLPEDTDSTAVLLTTDPVMQAPYEVAGFFSIMKERIETLCNSEKCK